MCDSEANALKVVDALLAVSLCILNGNPESNNNHIQILSCVTPKFRNGLIPRNGSEITPFLKMSTPPRGVLTSTWSTYERLKGLQKDLTYYSTWSVKDL
jgi:hypothetical protein